MYVQLYQFPEVLQNVTHYDYNYIDIVTAELTVIIAAYAVEL